MREVVVAGVGMTRFAKQPDLTLKDLARDAVTQALLDADLDGGAIQAAYVGNAIGGAITGQEMVAGQVVLRPLGFSDIPIFNVENACASSSSAMHLGWQAISSGFCDVVLCLGVEKMSHSDKKYALAAIGRAADVEVVFGAGGPESSDRSYFMDMYADLARKNLESGNVTREDFASVAVKNHRHGSLNPRAQFGGTTTVDEVLAAKEVVFPLTVPMCAPISDGAAAVILMARDVAPKSSRRTVSVAASIIGSGTLTSTGGANSTAKAASLAYERAGVGPTDLHHVELHDATASAELPIYESLGLAAAGEAARLLHTGDTALGGRVPVNTSGGLLSKGHPLGATGLAQVHEAVTQLRWEAGPRQVEGARWSLTQNGGGWLEGDNAAVAVHILHGRDA